jgi:hypothetical protein
MKLLKLSVLTLALLGTATMSKADVCVTTDPDFDEQTCTQLGGTVGTPLGQGGSPGSPSGVPLDGGASILLVAGVGYSIKQLRKRNNKNTTVAN